MKELLAKWAELEPERCRYHGEDLAGVGRFSVVLNGHEYPINYLSFAQLPSHQGNVQVAVQAGILEHKWRWEGGTDHSPAFSAAFVYGYNPKRRKTLLGKDAGEVEPFAAVLLSAYVQALKTAASW